MSWLCPRCGHIWKRHRRVFNPTKRVNRGRYTALVKAAEAVCKTHGNYMDDQFGEVYPHHVLDEIIPLQKALLGLPK